jgi:hypothetical protein
MSPATRASGPQLARRIAMVSGTDAPRAAAPTRRAAAAAIAAGSLAVAAACVDERGLDLAGTQSLAIELVDTPTGSIDRRLGDGERAIRFHLRARDASGAVDPSFNRAVRVYAQFLGTLTPALGQAPLATIQVVGGVAMDQQLTLPPSVLGPTTLWVDDGEGIGPAYVHGRIAGASATLWYRDPFIRDLQTPRSETALDALSSTPLQDKQVSVRASRHGASGRLVVTSVFSQGYTVSDVRCEPDVGGPRCTAEAYDHMLVFTFSAARGSDGHVLERGEVITGFAGGLTEFNGLTEIGFPQTFTPPFTDADGDGRNDAVVPGLEPPPALLDPEWFGPLSSSTGRINFERNEAAPIEIRGARFCALDRDYTTFKQWKLDVGGDGLGCGSKPTIVNVITAGVSTAFNPETAVPGTRLSRVVGVVRPVSIGSFNVWIIYPRSAADVTL